MENASGQTRSDERAIPVGRGQMPSKTGRALPSTSGNTGALLSGNRIHQSQRNCGSGCVECRGDALAPNPSRISHSRLVVHSGRIALLARDLGYLAEPLGVRNAPDGPRRSLTSVQSGS